MQIPKAVDAVFPFFPENCVRFRDAGFEFVEFGFGDAVFFANSLMAIGALTEFYDRGVTVPGDIAVATFDDTARLEDVRPRLTTAGNRPAVLARRAAQMLLERLSGKITGPARTEVIPCALQVFEST